MGNREKLLAGARQCLIERGWARTTVRDIATAAGVNHAAIGYHFGSREALLVQALVDAVDELDREVRAGAGAGDGTDPQLWAALLESFRAERALWVSQLEAIAQAAHVPALREHLAKGQVRAREGLGGPLPLAVILGLMVQSLVDPEGLPSAAEVAALFGPS
jgi:AcrR family transcriptional regulator